APAPPAPSRPAWSAEPPRRPAGPPPPPWAGQQRGRPAPRPTPEEADDDDYFADPFRGQRQ
ncbi:YbaB/EbfC family DNA-binding protein, partial [Actinosynnema sp. NPDC059335]